MSGGEPTSRRRRLLINRGAVGAGLLAAAALPTGVSTHPSAGVPDDEPYSFGLIGDTPYSLREEGALRQILAAMAQEPLAFVLHVGDIKSRLESCDEDLILSRLRLLDQCPHPLILTPGDNEWTDCNPSLPPWETGGALQRLQSLREQAYGVPESLGRRRMTVQQQAPLQSARQSPPQAPSQAPLQASLQLPGARSPVEAGGSAAFDSPGLPENLRWRVGGLQFCTLHVVGSNNAMRGPPAMMQAWLQRQQANGAWLNETVQQALREKAAGLVIALHANLRLESNRSDGWERMRSLVTAAAVAFDGPVLLLHGDTHHFRSDRPLQRSHGLANLQRVESFGSPFSSSWVQIRWNPAQAKAGLDIASEAFQVSIRALP